MSGLLNGRYQLIDELGRGAMGVVWRAEDTVLDREVAIKELRTDSTVDVREAHDRFLVEARAAARLSHPNIVAVHDVFSDGGRVLISMELVVGPTLQEVLKGAGAQPAPVVRAVMAQVAQALAAAHSRGVVHRDLKPENVFWTPDGRAVVADFGLARIGSGRGTVEGTLMGTPGYMAPEQVRGSALGPPVDVFGWGVLAYELASGQAPFGEPLTTDPVALAYRIVHEPLPLLVLEDDPSLAELIVAALAKDPHDRPPDGRALVERLQATSPRAGTPEGRSDFTKKEPTTPSPPAWPQAETLRDEPHTSWIVVALLLGLAVLVGAVVAIVASSSPSRTIVGGGSGATTVPSTTSPPTTSPPTTARPTPTTVAAPIGSLVVAITDVGAGWTLVHEPPANAPGSGPAGSPSAACLNYPIWENAASATFEEFDAGKAVRSVASFVLRGGVEADALAMYAGIASRYIACANAYPEDLQSGQPGARLISFRAIGLDGIPGSRVTRFEAVIRSQGGAETDTVHIVLLQKGRVYVEVAFESLRGPFPDDFERRILQGLAARIL